MLYLLCNSNAKVFWLKVVDVILAMLRVRLFSAACVFGFSNATVLAMDALHAIAAAVELIDGPSATATHLGMSPAAVSQWLSGTRQTPPERCPDIERLCGGRITADQLRPDVRWQRVPDLSWPHPDGRPCIDVARELAATSEAS